MGKNKFNIVNLYNNPQYLTRLLSVDPAKALRLHELLLTQLNSNAYNRRFNILKAHPVDDATELGVSRAMYQRYKKALLKAKIWTYDDKYRNNHRIAGDWHIAEDLLDNSSNNTDDSSESDTHYCDTYSSPVSCDDTRKNGDIPSNTASNQEKNDSKLVAHVSSHDTRHQNKQPVLVSSHNTRKKCEIPSEETNVASKNNIQNTKSVSCDDTSLVSSHDTYIYSILNKDIIDDDDIAKIYEYLIKDKYPFKYTGKVLAEQLRNFSSSYNKLPVNQRIDIFEKLYYAKDKPKKDTLNYVIQCAQNQLAKNTQTIKHSNRTGKHKRIEKGTDWSKKKPDNSSSMNTKDLKNIFSTLKNKY